MADALNLRWVCLGLFLGFVGIALGTMGMRPRPNTTPPDSPTLAVDDRESETILPSLRIECRNDDECVKTSVVDWKDNQGPLKRKFLRVLVYNDESGTAEDCKLTVRKIAEITPVGRVPVGYHTPGLLAWSGRQSMGPETKSIRRSTGPEVADLLYTVHHPAGDQIFLKDEAHNSLLRYGRWYAFEVVATSVNVREASKTIKVRCGAKWDDVQVLSD